MTRLLLTLLLPLTIWVSATAQQPRANQQLTSLNEYVNFTNEGIHGMLIVHRLLENYNQELNKYVDLDSYIINNFSNKDLPSNIFEDKENWFYDDSPLDWLEKITANNSLTIVQKTSLTQKAGGLRRILDDINALRFDVENLIATLDLTQRSEVVKVYEKLEEGVTHYQDFYLGMQLLVTELEKYYGSLNSSSLDMPHQALYTAMQELYQAQRALLVSLREKDDAQYASQIQRFELALQLFSAVDFTKSSKLSDPKVKRYRANILEQSRLALASAKKFYNTAEVPQEFKQYGKFYFYYNSDIINNFNRYGNGTVFELNNIVKKLNLPVLLFTELPHYYKVIYPKKLEKVDYIAATDSEITALPSQLKDRDITLSRHKIKVDSIAFTVEFYDHMIEDGDIISLNFNGDWILEQMPLKSKPRKLKLKVNEQGKNYFLLHAENVGRRPPNTMAVKYIYRGREQQIILKSDLNTSEMIEIVYTPSE